MAGALHTGQAALESKSLLSATLMPRSLKLLSSSLAVSHYRQAVCGCAARESKIKGHSVCKASLLQP